MKATLHNSWSDLEWRTFQTVHGFCPLCCQYHDLFLDRNLYYCPQQHVDSSGWDATLYNKLIVSPQDVDINQYNDIKYRTMKAKLLRTLPFMIEKRTAMNAEIQAAKVKQSQPQVIVERVQPIVVNNQPRFDQQYWVRVADAMGI